MAGRRPGAFHMASHSCCKAASRWQKLTVQPHSFPAGVPLPMSVDPTVEPRVSKPRPGKRGAAKAGGVQKKTRRAGKLFLAGGPGASHCYVCVLCQRISLPCSAMLHSSVGFLYFYRCKSSSVPACSFKASDTTHLPIHDPRLHFSFLF